MDQKLPMFDDTPAETAPKKPKPKPTRKRRRKLGAVRKQRVARIVKSEPHYSVSPDVLKAISVLMNLDLPLRNFAMEVTKALTK